MKHYSHHRKNLHRSELEIIALAPRATRSTARSEASSSRLPTPSADAVESVNHLVDPEHALRIAMARQ
jgi:hypothetical protein